MSYCISRRACQDRYNLKLINNEGKTGKQVWTEYLCPNVASKNSEFCEGCSEKVPKYRFQATMKCNHGVVGGSYTSDSKLYGSPFYLNELKLGWKLSEVDEIRAKDAVDKAISEMAGRKKKVESNPVIETSQEVLPQPVAEPMGEVKPTAKPKIKKPRAKKEKEEKTPGVRGRPRKVKLKEDVELPSIEPVKESEIEPKFIESILPPIMITDCVVVKVKKMKCQGKDYYYDEFSRKLYGISVNGVGAYKGRYNVEDDLVDTTFPDSDCEEV